MPLPSRPLGSDKPPRSPQPQAKPVEVEDFSLPDLDFESVKPSNTPEVRQATSVPDELPDIDSLFTERPSAPPQVNLPEPPTQLPTVAPAPVATGISDDELDALFEESSSPAQAEDLLEQWDNDPAPQSSEPEENYAELFDDDWDNLDEPTDSPAPVAAPVSSSKPVDDFDSFFEEPEENEAPQEQESKMPESWDDDFDKFMEELDKPLEDEEEPASEYVSTFDEETSEEEAQKPLKKDKSKSKGKGKSPKKRSGGFANAVFRTLTSIPLIGILFRPLAKLAGFGLAILTLIPLLAIPVVIYFIAASQVPGESGVVGPDSSAASFSNFSYSNGEAKGVVQNLGDTIADVVPTMKVWSYNPLGGGSIFAFDEVASCEGEEVSVDIDQNQEISIPCEATPGPFTKVSGTLSF